MYVVEIKVVYWVGKMKLASNTINKYIMYVIMVHVHVGILSWEMKLASNTHIYNLYVIMVHVHVGILGWEMKLASITY